MVSVGLRAGEEELKLGCASSLRKLMSGLGCMEQLPRYKLYHTSSVHLGLLTHQCHLGRISSRLVVVLLCEGRSLQELSRSYTNTRSTATNIKIYRFDHNAHRFVVPSN
jgi:hypothetical protein